MALPTRVLHGQSEYDPAREFDTMLSRWFGNRQSEGGSLAPYGVDVREDQDHLYVEAELPGFKKDEVEITLENQTLSIMAERRSEKNDEKKGDLLLHERRYSRFHRSFTLPSTVSDQKVNAKLADGVLTITLDKREETKPRKIQVS